MAKENTQTAQIVCAGNIQANGTVRKQRGCVVVRTGVGVYTVTIDPVNPSLLPAAGQGNLSGGIPAAEFLSEAQVVSAGEAYIQIANTSDTVKTVSIIDAADAPLDAQFEFVFKRVIAKSNPAL